MHRVCTAQIQSIAFLYRIARFDHVIQDAMEAHAIGNGTELADLAL